VKGVILAGGKGTRLDPLTRITNKHLLPIYDRPMVTYAIEAMVGAGVKEIMVVTGGTHAGEFLRLLGNGDEFGIHRLLYAYQDKPGGIAEALGLAEQVGEPQLLFPCYDGLATLYLDTGNHRLAETYLAKAQGVCERAGVEPDALMVLPFLY